MNKIHSNEQALATAPKDRQYDELRQLVEYLEILDKDDDQWIKITKSG